MSDAGQGTAPGDGAPAALTERLTEALGLDPAQVDWLGEESARTGANLLILLERGWPEMVAVAGHTAALAFGGALVAGLATAVVGWLLYLFTAGPLLRRGWQTGRLIGCSAATVVLLCAGAGGGWAGMWLGAGRALETAIEERYVVERTAAATFLAFTLEAGELPQSLDPDATERLLAGAQTRSAESWASFRARAEATASEAGVDRPGWLRADLLVRALEGLGGDGAPDLLGLHGVLSIPESGPGGDPLPQTAELRRQAAQLLWGTVYIQVATGVGFGLVLPLAGLALLGALGILIRKSPIARETGAEPSRAPD